MSNLSSSYGVWHELSSCCENGGNGRHNLGTHLRSRTHPIDGAGKRVRGESGIARTPKHKRGCDGCSLWQCSSIAEAVSAKVTVFSVVP